MVDKFSGTLVHDGTRLIHADRLHGSKLIGNVNAIQRYRHRYIMPILSVEHFLLNPMGFLDRVESVD